jgi:hypothetical protein
MDFPLAKEESIIALCVMDLSAGIWIVPDNLFTPLSFMSIVFPFLSLFPSRFQRVIYSFSEINVLRSPEATGGVNFIRQRRM